MLYSNAIFVAELRMMESFLLMVLLGQGSNLDHWAILASGSCSGTEVISSFSHVKAVLF